MKNYTFEQFKSKTNIKELIEECFESESKDLEITDALYRDYYDQAQNNNYWCQTILTNLEIKKSHSQATQECDSSGLHMSAEVEDFPNSSKLWTR